MQTPRQVIPAGLVVRFCKRLQNRLRVKAFHYIKKVSVNGCLLFRINLVEIGNVRGTREPFRHIAQAQNHKRFCVITQPCEAGGELALFLLCGLVLCRFLFPLRCPICLLAAFLDVRLVTHVTHAIVCGGVAGVDWAWAKAAYLAHFAALGFCPALPVPGRVAILADAIGAILYSATVHAGDGARRHGSGFFGLATRRAIALVM
jgi:hypothetical protein